MNENYCISIKISLEFVPSYREAIDYKQCLKLSQNVVGPHAMCLKL